MNGWGKVCQGTISTGVIAEGENAATSRNPEGCCYFLVGSGPFMVTCHLPLALPAKSPPHEITPPPPASREYLLVRLLCPEDRASPRSPQRLLSNVTFGTPSSPSFFALAGDAGAWLACVCAPYSQSCNQQGSPPTDYLEVRHGEMGGLGSGRPTTYRPDSKVSRNPNFCVGCFELIISKNFVAASKMGKNGGKLIFFATFFAESIFV